MARDIRQVQQSPQSKAKRKVKGDIQAAIPGTSETENFSLVNPETEISPNLYKQVIPKNWEHHISGTVLPAFTEKIMTNGLPNKLLKAG